MKLFPKKKKKKNEIQGYIISLLIIKSYYLSTNF